MSTTRRAEAPCATARRVDDDHDGSGGCWACGPGGLDGGNPCAALYCGRTCPHRWPGARVRVTNDARESVARSGGFAPSAGTSGSHMPRWGTGCRRETRCASLVLITCADGGEGVEIIMPGTDTVLVTMVDHCTAEAALGEAEFRLSGGLPLPSDPEAALCAARCAASIHQRPVGTECGARVPLMAWRHALAALCDPCAEHRAALREVIHEHASVCAFTPVTEADELVTLGMAGVA